MKIDPATDDLGAVRLAKAQSINATVSEVVRVVSGLHAVRADVIRNPKTLQPRSHIVMARSHACWLLKGEGLNMGEIARALHMDRATVLRAIRRWNDHKAGKLGSATESQVWAVKARVEKGMSVTDACNEVGVGASRYESRLTMMRQDGKL